MNHELRCPCCLKTIKNAEQIVITDKNYDYALKLISIFMNGDPEEGTLQAKLLDLLSNRVEAYEIKMFPIGEEDKK